MKRPAALQAHQIEKCADFLEAHPAFSPVLCGQEALEIHPGTGVFCRRKIQVSLNSDVPSG